MPKFCPMVRTSSSGPPVSKAVLIRARVVWPGMSTSRSRGNDSTEALTAAGSTRSTMIVSVSLVPATRDSRRRALGAGAVVDPDEQVVLGVARLELVGVEDALVEDVALDLRDLVVGVGQRAGGDGGGHDRRCVHQDQDPLGPGTAA